MYKNNNNIFILFFLLSSIYWSCSVSEIISLDDYYYTGFIDLNVQTIPSEIKVYRKRLEIEGKYEEIGVFKLKSREESAYEYEFLMDEKDFIEELKIRSAKEGADAILIENNSKIIFIKIDKVVK